MIIDFSLRIYSKKCNKLEDIKMLKQNNAEAQNYFLHYQNPNN
jgi:hypothetical protein